MLLLAGIACLFVLSSCAPRTMEMPKAERAERTHPPVKPRCTRTVVRYFPGKTQTLHNLVFIDGQYILVTELLDSKSYEAPFLYYRLNLKDLTVSPYQNAILGENQKLEGVFSFNKGALFLVSKNEHFSVILKYAEKITNIPLPFVSKEVVNQSRIYVDQNNLFIYWGGRLLQWDIQNGKVGPCIEIKTDFGIQPGSCCFPFIDNFENGKLWLSNDTGSVYLFNLKTRIRTVVKKGSQNHNFNFVRDKSGRNWTWHVSNKNLGHTLDAVLFDLVCSEKGQFVSKYELTGIQSLFFDKNDVPMVWTKSGAVLKLVGDKFVQLIESPEFSQKTRSWADAAVLEDGRICLYWKFSRDPDEEKVNDPILKIIDLEKNEYEVMRFPFQLK